MKKPRSVEHEVSITYGMRTSGTSMDYSVIKTHSAEFMSKAPLSSLPQHKETGCLLLWSQTVAKVEIRLFSQLGFNLVRCACLAPSCHGWGERY